MKLFTSHWISLYLEIPYNNLGPSDSSLRNGIDSKIDVNKDHSADEYEKDPPFLSHYKYLSC